MLLGLIPQRVMQRVLRLSGVLWPDVVFGPGDDDPPTLLRESSLLPPAWPTEQESR